AFGHTHAYYLIINAVYPYIFTTRVFARVEKALVNTFADNAHFASLAYVYVVDKSSVSHILVFNLCIVRIKPFHAAIVLFLSINGCRSPAGYRWSDYIDVF